MPYPLPLTRTEAYLAYKAGVIQQSDLKPSLAVPRNGIDAWLAYWTGLAEDYPKREDGAPHILQEEEAYIAYLCGVINEYPEKCLRRVGAYLRYLISARWGRPDHPLNREELYLSLIKTQFIPSGDPSSDIVIDGTAKAPFVDVKLYGDTFQQTYTGKNMVGFPAMSYEQHDLTFDFDADGTITINGTRSGTTATSYNSSVLFNFSAGDITFTIIPISGSFSGANIGYRAIAGDSQAWYQVASSSGGYSQETINKTAEQVAQITSIVLLIGSGRAVFDNFKFKIQVTAGTSHDTNFEPFVGGVPSPNPDYPQPIQTVTGEQTVSINGTNYPISLGSLELCKLDTYQDYIWKDGEDWKVHREIGKVTLDGSETWTKSSANSGYRFWTSKATDIKTSIDAVLKANRLGVSQGDTWEYDGISGSYSTNPIRLFIRDAFFNDMTVEQLRGWLATHNIIAYYALATPTDTVITDQNLINQLNALKQGGAENGTTYIKVNATDPNLPGLLYVEAPKYE